MLNLESKMEILGITVFQDTDDSDQFYYLPGPPRISREDGRPLFDLFTYRRAGAEGDELAGGFLNMTVDADIGRRGQIEGRLRRQFGGEVTLAPVPIIRGAVRAIALDAGGAGGVSDIDGEDPDGESSPRFVQRILGSGVPSLYGDNRAILSFSLSEEGTALLMGALGDAPDVRPVGIVYELDYLGLLPAYDLEITIDFAMAADYLDRRLSLDLVLFKTDIVRLVEDLRREEAITVRETARTLELSTPEAMQQRQERIDELVLQLATGALFTPTLSPRLRDAATAAGGADAPTVRGGNVDPDGDEGSDRLPARGGDTDPGENEDSGSRPGGGGDADSDGDENSGRRRGGGGNDDSEEGEESGRRPGSDAEEDSGPRPDRGGDADADPDEDSDGRRGDAEEADGDAGGKEDDDSDAPGAGESAEDGESDDDGDPDDPSDGGEDDDGSPWWKQAAGALSDRDQVYTYRRIRQSERRAVTYNLSQTIAQQRTVAPQSFLRLLAGPGEFAERVHAVDLDHPFFRRIDVNVNAHAVDFDAEGVVQLLVQMRYGTRPDGTGPKDTAEAILRRAEDSRDFTFFVDAGQSQSYEYRLVVDYRSDFGIGVRDARVRGPWTETEARSLSVHPGWLRRTLPVTVQLAPNLPADVQEAHVRVRYRSTAHDIDDSRIVRLTPERRSEVVPIRLADEREEYEAAPVLYYTDGTREELPVLRAPDDGAAAANRTVVVSALRSDRLDGDIVMLDPLGELQGVLVDMEVRQDGAVVYARTFELAAAGERKIWSVRLSRGDVPVELGYRQRRFYADGGFEEDDWRSAISRSLTVGIPAEGVFSVSVNYIGPELADLDISALVVDLVYGDPDGDPRFDQRTSLLITDGPDSDAQDWRVRRAGRDANTYRWRVTVYYADGREAAGEFREDDRPLLLVHPGEIE